MVQAFYGNSINNKKNTIILINSNITATLF